MIICQSGCVNIVMTCIPSLSRLSRPRSWSLFSCCRKCLDHIRRVHIDVNPDSPQLGIGCQYWCFIMVRKRRHDSSSDCLSKCILTLMCLQVLLLHWRGSSLKSRLQKFLRVVLWLQDASRLVPTPAEPSLQGSTVNCVLAPVLSIQLLYLLLISELVLDYFREICNEIVADTGLLKARHLNKPLPCPNPKARKYYKFEEDPVPPVLHFPPTAAGFVERRQLSCCGEQYQVCLLKVPHGHVIFILK